MMFLFAFCRALNTINIREENEKLNIWVAYFNLENEYGNPPQVLEKCTLFFVLSLLLRFVFCFIN